MRYPFYILLYLIVSCFSSGAQQQSIIYDATTIMNAKYGLYALLTPLPGTADGGAPFTARHPLNGKEFTPLPAKFNIDSAKAVIYEVLRRNANLPVGSTPAVIMAAYAGNPFLKTIDTDNPVAFKHGIDINAVTPFIVSNLSGGLGSNILGNIVNGTADFLIKRAQEEISISVFERLKAILAQYPEFGKLFPNTCALIEPIPAYEYSRALQAFKAAIKEDMEGFIGHIGSLYDIPRYQLLNQKVPSLTLLFSASTVIAEANGDKSFAAGVSVLSQQNFLHASNNYAAVIQTLAVISNSLTDQSLNDPPNKPLNYIHPQYIAKVTHDDPAMLALLSKVYLGLLWQKTQAITFVTNAGSQTVAQFLNRWNLSPTIQDALNVVNKIVALMQTAEDGLKEVKAWEQTSAQLTGKNQLNTKRLTYYANLVSALLDLAILYKDPAKPAVNTRIQEIATWFPQFTTAVITMVKNFSEEEYNLGIAKLADVLTILSNYLETVEKNKAETKALSSAVKLSLDGEKAAFNTRINAIDGKINAITHTGNPALDRENEALRQEYLAEKQLIQKKIEEVDAQLEDKHHLLFKLPTVIKYVNLLAAVSKAENSAAVEKLLETYALPAGSSRIKKVTDFNIAVNAYVGGFFGRSGVPGSGFTNRYGLTAPIGFSMSHGFYKAGSISAFLGVFDIGGTIRYKLDNQGKYQQDVSLAGIVSPGIHAVYGFPWYLPLSAGIGCQWVSPVTADADKISLKPSFNAFLAVDIPLFNLTRSK
ncbi:hypothetical protein D3H65_06875 [Paraflavitalea soli]|uniref:Uncharacterized protein n=1 Tax=Paraflavitalea soli TaxID=2315862 RepID=A0A3B7MJD2_9BACT|nr:hypothetical protein [Paraflavitalea soli]AXY73717.1 hypothetical protein D3H65_06875 [Paraflavitalea soli]